MAVQLEGEGTEYNFPLLTHILLYRVGLPLVPKVLFTFYRPLCGGRSRSHFVTQSVSKTQMSHLETSNADTAQSKEVWNENLEFLRSSADCLLSADCLQNPN